MRTALFTTLVMVAACSDPPAGDYLIVTVNKRPAVNDAKMLKVKLSNGGSDRSQDLDLSGKDFPVTFSVTTPGRTGDLGIEVSALDMNGLLVGRGASMTTVDMDAATVLVDSADFVVNDDFADDQELANYYFTAGYQLAATSDGNWTAVHSVRCSGPCNVFGRRFASTGKPITSTVAAGPGSFPLSTRQTTFWTTPAIAANANTTLAFWNHDINNPEPPAGSPGYSIDCRAFDTMGAALTGQITLSTDELANMVTVAPLSNGNFAVGWEGRVTTNIIRSAIVKPDCTILSGAGPLTVSTVAGTGSPQYVSVASSGNQIMYAWMLDGQARIRTQTLAGSFASVDSVIALKTATEQVEHVRVAALPGGNFAVFVRWANIMGTTGPGRIEMIKTNNVGALMGTPTVITTKSGTDFSSSQGFGVAAHGDGSILVVWHSCAMNGDDSMCGVFGHLVSNAGTPVGTDFSLSTTTTNDQTGPSAVALPGSPTSFVTAWTDRSMQAPDTAGASVRARIVYPDNGSGGM